MLTDDLVLLAVVCPQLKGGGLKKQEVEIGHWGRTGAF